MGHYDEYLDRANWGPSESLHGWTARRILLELVRIAGLEPKTTDILEIGAGTGRAGVLAQRLGFASYTGVEPAQALAEFSRAQRGLKIIDEALPELRGVPNDAYGAAFSIHVLEHASNYMAARDWCAEMIRVVRPGGVVLVVAPDIRDFRNYFWDSDWSHGFPTTPQRVAQVFQDLDIDVEFEGSMHIGRLNGMSAMVAHVVSAFLPTRLGDIVTQRVVGRPLVSGLKIATLWGLVFVVGRKRRL